MIVTSANMSIDYEVIGLTLNCKVVYLEKFLTDTLKICILAIADYATLRNKNAPCAVVKLDISATCIVKIFDYLFVSVCNIVDKFFICRIELPCRFNICRNDELLEKLCGSRNCLLCYCVFILKSLYKFVMFNKRMTVNRDFAGKPCIVNQSLFAVECNTVFGFFVFNSVKSPQDAMLLCGIHRR